jgi:LacI family repressor for deo operon, udp, cdd, tsx, nupC, and nupG
LPDLEDLADNDPGRFHNGVATLAEIAAYAGVSEATVSRVLNDRPGVSEASRQAVLTSLDVLGYERPARLRRRSAGLVGLVVPELDNPIFPAFAQVMGTLLAQRGYTSVLATQIPGGVSEDEYVDSLLDHGVAGIIFVSGLHADTTADRARYQRLIDRGLPVVFINGYSPDLAAPFVSDDDVTAMDLAVGHLAQLGHRQIGLVVGQRRFVPSMRKIDGFVAALCRTFEIAQEEAQGWVETTMFTLEGGNAGAERLLERGATAVVCGSDLMALGAVRAARRRGLDVPGDVSVIGYDDIPLAAVVDPPLTTIRQSVPAMGMAAVNALLESIGGTPVPTHEYMFRPELVLRASSGACKSR